MEEIIVTNTEKETSSAIESAIALDQNAIPYTAQSECTPMDTLVPLSLYSETFEAQMKIKEQIKESFDSYVLRKLKFSSKIQMCRPFSEKGFAAEQIDAIAMAIYQIENGKSLIVADMAGIGKGRICAGIARYAYANGYTPVFVTQSANLFSDFYRDLYDIGGFHDKKEPVPFILNGYKYGGTYTDENTRKKVKKAGETDVVMNGKTIFKAQSSSEIKKVLSSGQLPKEYDLILATYSQFSSDKEDDPKRMFMVNNADKIILILDEAHNAAGNSATGKFFQSLAQSTKGTLFVSATFAKRTDNIFLYVKRTDITKLDKPTNEIFEAVKEGGDRLQEYLSGALARSGQLLRRERGFSKCGLDTVLTNPDDVDKLFYDFDQSVKYYVELSKFCGAKNGGSGLFQKAKLNAINRFLAKNKGEIAGDGTIPAGLKADERLKWYQRHEGKYIVSYTAGDMAGALFYFTETLLFALKAELVAQVAVEELTTLNLQNNSTKGTVFLSNRKPIIAVRSTLESIIDQLNMKLDVPVNIGDFSRFLLALVEGSQRATIKITEIRVKDLEERAKKKKGEKAKKHGKIIEEPNWQIYPEDYPDNGKEYDELHTNVSSLKLDLPLSPIDALIDHIQETKRASGDLSPNTSQYLQVGEVTGRKYIFTKTEEFKEDIKRLMDSGLSKREAMKRSNVDGKYVLRANPKETNKFNTFSGFNNGKYDVLIINESGSTGASAHSSVDFKDQRPRSMIIHQVELDINTEVQKKGRINRTGQLYYPTYIYAISRIPSETRRLNMMLRKLRTLDAVTSANQRQSSAQTEIKDRFGNPIQDIVNKYGFIALQDFLSVQHEDEDGNVIDFQQYLPSDWRSGGDEEVYIISFLRNIELISAKHQEMVYDALNLLYISEVEKAKAAKTYTEETEIKDLKATPKNRILLKEGKGDSPFNEPVFEEDNFVNREDKPLTKEEYTELAFKLAGSDRVDKFHEQLIEDFKKNYNEVSLPRALQSVVLLDLEQAENDDERNAWNTENNEKLEKAERRASEHFKELLAVINFFSPLKKVKIPDDFEAFYENISEEGKFKDINRNLGVFVGYRITDNGSADKFSAMNIELIFAQLSGKNKVIIKPTSVKGRPSIEILKNMMLPMNQPTNLELEDIGYWIVNKNERILNKFLTGNILDAYEEAKLRVADSDKYKKTIEFVKFTTRPENTIRLGLRLSMKSKYIEADPNNSKTLMPINSSNLLSRLEEAANQGIEIKRQRNEERRIRREIKEDENYNVTMYNGNRDLCLMYYQSVDGLKRISLHIFGGLKKAQGAKEKKANFSKKFYDNQEFWNLSSLEVTESELAVKGSSDRENTVLSKSITLDGSKIKDKYYIEQFYLYLNYIYEQQGVFINIGLGKTKESLHNVKDPEVKGEAEQEDGTFKYYLLLPYSSLESKLNAWNKFHSFELSDIYKNGVITTNRRASMDEILANKIAPAEITPKLMYSNLVSRLTVQEKINFNNDLKQMAINNAPFQDVAKMIAGYVGYKISDFQQIFGIVGRDRKLFSEILIAYILSPEAAQSDVEVEAEPLPPTQEPTEANEISLDFDTAQDFIILMNYNI